MKKLETNAALAASLEQILDGLVEPEDLKRTVVMIRQCPIQIYSYFQRVRTLQHMDLGIHQSVKDILENLLLMLPPPPKAEVAMLSLENFQPDEHLPSRHLPNYVYDAWLAQLE